MKMEFMLLRLESRMGATTSLSVGAAVFFIDTVNTILSLRASTEWLSRVNFQPTERKFPSPNSQLKRNIEFELLMAL